MSCSEYMSHILLSFGLCLHQLTMSLCPANQQFGIIISVFSLNNKCLHRFDAIAYASKRSSPVSLFIGYVVVEIKAKEKKLRQYEHRLR